MAKESSSGCRSALQWIAKHLLLDLLNEGDDFAMMLRKIVIGSGVALFIHPLFYGLYFLAYAVRDGFTPATVCFILLCAEMFAIIVFTYLYARITKTIPDAIVELWCIGIAVALTGASFCSTWNPLMMPLIVTAFNATLCQTRRLPLCLCVSGGGALLTIWNTAAITSGAAPLFMPGVRHDSFVEQIFNGISAFAIAVVPIACCILQAQHHVQLLAAVKESAALSSRVAQHLSNYDTDAVDEELADYRAEAAQPDAQLIHNYESLVSNLNKYRPHLPNWMINNSSESSNGESSGRLRSARSAGSSRSQTDSQNVSSARLSASSSQGDSSRGGSEIPLHRVVGHVQGFGRPHQVSYAQLDFGRRPGMTSALKDSAVTAFVDNIHDWAAATSGSLHSFVADTLLISWNATHSVAQPEAKAARFLAKVVAANANPNSGVAAAGAMFSGKAACNFSGSGRVQALTMSMQWRDKLRALHAFATRHGAVVMDGVSAHTAAFTVVTRGIDVLPPVDGEKQVAVHEVVAERETADDDEWMYTLKRSVDSSNDSVTAALQLGLAGQLAEAVRMLEELPDAAVRATPLVRRLQQRLESAMFATEAALPSGVDFIASFQPNVSP
jgi:hypothetical protein